MRISLAGYDSTIRKVSRCEPTLSNEAILGTKQEVFLTKVAPVQIITHVVLMLFSWTFVSSYITIYFFVINFFSNVYISVNTAFECSYLLFFSWEIAKSLSMCAIGVEWKWRGIFQNAYKCVQGQGVKKLIIR